jgi:hypothetical protein
MARRPGPPRTRTRRIVRGVLIGVGVLALAIGMIAAWAVNRYILDHVEIGDVAAYEAQQAAAASTTSSGSSAATGSVAARPAVTTTTAAPVLTATTYRLSGTGSATVTYFVADVVLGSGTELRSAFAQNKFGSNIIDDTSDIAAANGAVFAINGDYYGFRSSGIVIRNGVIYRDKPARQGLAVFRDGRMELYDEKSTSAQQLLDGGVWNTLSFGPGLVDGGQVLPGIDKVEIDTNIGNRSIQGNQPRTGLGMIEPNHFVFVAVDGRSNGYSRGVTMTELATIFTGLGAKVAYNLDGGGSTTMVFNGSLVNSPLGKGAERGTSDILYIGGAPAVAS